MDKIIKEIYENLDKIDRSQKRQIAMLEKQKAILEFSLNSEDNYFNKNKKGEYHGYTIIR